jgi:hypothetical protein
MIAIHFQMVSFFSTMTFTSPSVIYILLPSTHACRMEEHIVLADAQCSCCFTWNHLCLCGGTQRAKSSLSSHQWPSVSHSADGGIEGEMEGWRTTEGWHKVTQWYGWSVRFQGRHWLLCTILPTNQWHYPGLSSVCSSLYAIWLGFVCLCEYVSVHICAWV